MHVSWVCSGFGTTTYYTYQYTNPCTYPLPHTHTPIQQTHQHKQHVQRIALIHPHNTHNMQRVPYLTHLSDLLSIEPARRSTIPAIHQCMHPHTHSFIHTHIQDHLESYTYSYICNYLYVLYTCMRMFHTHFRNSDSYLCLP